MKIILEQLVFNNAKEFIDYLARSYEQVESNSKEVNLLISYDVYESESAKELVQFLLRPNAGRLYNLRLMPENLNPEQKKLEQLLNNIYLFNKRSSFSEPSKERLIFPERITVAFNNLTVFPVKELIGFKTLDGVDKDKSEALFNAVIDVVEKAGTDVEDELLIRVIEVTTAVIQSKMKTSPEIVPLLTLLMKTCGNGTKSEWMGYCTLIDKLQKTDDETLKQWMKILAILGENAGSENIRLLLDVQAGLEFHSVILKDISTLFRYPPYPALDVFVEELRKDSRNLKAYIDSFDADPKGAREPKFNKEGILVKSSEQILKGQFETGQIRKVIAEIQSIVDGASLSSKEQYKLAQQVVYINAIGKDYPLKAGDKTYTNLTALGRNKLRELSDLLITEIRRPNISKQDKLRAQLNLLAVMREQYFRSTGLFINTTQIISVLLSLHHQEHNVLMEMNTKEGKRAPTAILAAMQWVLANGGTVDVCTANNELLIQDYQERGARDFFIYLGIPSAAIESNSMAGSYQIGGINYSTIPNLVSYCSHANIEDEKLSVDRYGRPVYRHLILHGCDFSTLDDRTLFNFSSNFDFYKEHGRIVRVEENPGANSQRLGQRGKFDMDVAYRILPYKKNLYEALDTHELPNLLEHINVIKNRIIHVETGQPIVLIAKNANQVTELYKTLKLQLNKDGKKYKIRVLTGEESEEKRQEWIKEQAGNANTITITTSSSILGYVTDFDTKHPKGFLTIQSYLDTPGMTKKILNRVSRNGKPGQYVAVYEENPVKSRSWAFQTKEDKQNILLFLEKIQYRRNEEAAIERYFKQSVSSIQQVVLRQFEEWQAFLHLIYPKSEWRQLDNELFVQREELITSLREQWRKCLEDSDLKKTYPNPYVRRDAYHRLQTKELELALQEYEKSVATIWSKSRIQLKAKTENRLPEGSVNAERCRHLECVELKEQIKWDKLTTRRNKKEIAQEKKRSHRHLEFALDVNGAMLRYYDGDLEPYRLPFVNSQLKRFARDISKVINNSSLSTGVKRSLIDRVNNADNLISLELVLIDYKNRWLNKNKLAEKFRMQPIISDIFRVYKLAGLEENKELNVLKETYLDNAATEIIHNLENTLAWAKPENRGFWYWIERSAVKTAANEILAVVHELKQARDSYSQQEALKKLYRVLSKHQTQLEDVWIFSFGHKNTRDLINQTLNTIDGLTVIGCGEETLNADFIQECKEEAQYHLLQEKLNSFLKEFEKNNSTVLNSHSEWQSIKQQLQQIQNENNNAYALNEMYYVLNKKINELSISSSLLRQPLVQIRGTIRTLWNNFQEQHQELVSESKYFDYKAQKIKKELEGVDGYHVDGVTVKMEHTGFNDYLDLIIEGTGTIPLFDDFTQYQSRLPELTNALQKLRISLDQSQLQLLNLNKCQTEQLPLLKPGVKVQSQPELFPEQYQSKVKEILVLKEFAHGRLPEDLNRFPEEIQNHFLDRNRIKAMDSSTMTMEQINQIKNVQLKTELTELYNKIHKINVEQPKSWFSLGAVIDFITTPFRVVETDEDWRYQFAELQGRSDGALQQFLTQEITMRYDDLINELALVQREVAQQIDSISEQIEFLSDKILEEENKTGVSVKRFGNLNELYAFEADLRNYKALHPRKEVMEEQIESEDITLSSSDEDESESLDEFLKQSSLRA